MCAHFPGSSRLRVLLVMPSHQLARRGAELGFRIWSVWDPARLEADFASRLAEASEQLLLTDFADEAGLREAIARTVRCHGIDAIVHCGHGSTVLPVAEEAWRLGLSPNPPAVYERLRDRAGRAPAPAPRVSVETLTVHGIHHGQHRSPPQRQRLAQLTRGRPPRSPVSCVRSSTSTRSPSTTTPRTGAPARSCSSTHRTARPAAPA